MTQLAPVIVVGCQKGGIGRTAVAVNLASMLALAGLRTLLVDLDDKGDATASVGLPRSVRGKSTKRLAEPWSLLKDTLSADRPAGLDVWPGGPALKKLQRQLNQVSPGRTNLLGEGLELARQRYRVVVIDAPPTLGPLTTNALATADVLLMPIAEKAFMERALSETIIAALGLGAEYQVFGVRLETREPGPQEDAREEESQAEGPLGVHMLDSSICYDAQTFNQAAAAGLPVFEAAPGSRAARCFLELAREVIAKIITPREREGAPS